MGGVNASSAAAGVAPLGAWMQNSWSQLHASELASWTRANLGSALLCARQTGQRLVLVSQQQQRKKKFVLDVQSESRAQRCLYSSRRFRLVEEEQH